MKREESTSVHHVEYAYRERENEIDIDKIFVF